MQLGHLVEFVHI